MMRCEGIQEYLAERLAGSLSDKLSKTVYSHVRTHLLSCPECCEELDGIEEIQKLLQTIPLEPCDSDLMRARFHLLLGGKDSDSSHRSPTAPVRRIRPLKGTIVSFAAILAVIATVLVSRQAVKWITSARVAPPLATPASTPSPKPVTAPIRTGAIFGQIHAISEEFLRGVRVSVTSVPKPGMPATEIAVKAGPDGKYRIANIPAGQYYVLARTADTTTYYPGTRDIAGATVVSIQPAAVLEGIDFANFVTGDRPASPPVPDESAVSVPQLVVVDVMLRLDTDGRLPYWPDTSIIFTGANDASRVSASCFVGNLFRASVPANASYTLSISNVAPGYAIQSIVDSRMTDLLHGGVFAADARPGAPSRIVVTLTKN